MQEYLFEYEAIVRAVCFIVLVTTLAYWENKRPWRYISHIKSRWINHLTMVGVSTIFVRFVFPFVLVDLALEIQDDYEWSLLLMPELRGMPYWAHFILGFIGLDLAMYWQHRVLHRVKLLWRLHLMHHTDKRLDASTGLRFHPLEFLFSMGFKMLAIVFFGPPAAAVIVFEIVLNGASMFTHANIQLKPRFERRLRYLIVTPSMHRVHHSDIPRERDSNFGFFFSFWDRLFKTYRPFSMMGERKIVMGEEHFRDASHQTIKGMLLQPFFRKSKRKRKKGPAKLIRPPV